MQKIVEKLELFVWVIIFWGVIFLNLSSQLLSIGRVYLLSILSAMFLFYLSDQTFIQKLSYPRLKKNIIRFLVLFLYFLIIFLILYFQKTNLWIFYFFPILTAFILALTFVAQPRTLFLILIMISLFVLGEVYWESKVSPENLVRIEFYPPFTKIFSLSLLVIFGYYLYRNQQMVRRTLEVYNQNLKNLNEELKKKTIELETANKRLRELSEAKSVFVATVSHELRTPLTAILNALKLIGYEIRDNEKVSEFMEIIKKNIDRQSLMIDNLLDAAKLERGVPDTRRTNFELNRLIKEVIETMSLQADAKQIELKFFPSEENSYLWGEAEGLKRVFINLIDNAIKFTPEKGKVTVKVEKDEDNFRIIVSDTGCGIAKADQEKIFEPFVQVEGSQPTKKGIGLGLTIVREIINRHQGKVWLESEPGKGSKFFVQLPMDLRKSKR